MVGLLDVGFFKDHTCLTSFNGEGFMAMVIEGFVREISHYGVIGS